jgi:chromosome segregation ATPase
MRKRPIASAVLLILAAASGGIITVISAQSNRPVTTNEMILAEIRSLRADLQHTSTEGVRAQLLVGRLQLEEQRLQGLNSELAEAHGRLVVRRAQIATLARVVEDLKNTLAPSGVYIPDLEARRNNLEAALQQSQGQLQDLQLEEEQMSEQEAELSQQVLAQHNRSTYLNDQLDAIERRLSH